MSAALRLPPSGRDFFVYERVVVDLQSTRQTAEEAQISQTRVRQIVRRVIEWLGETLPEDTQLSEAAQFRAGRQIAADRLEAHYREAARKWRTTEQPKFAGLAIRIIAAQVRLPVVAGKYEALMADVLEGPLPEEEPQPLQPKSQTVERRKSKAESQEEQAAAKSTCDIRTATFDPPNADCSATTLHTASGPESTAAGSAAEPSPASTSDDLTLEARAARAAFFGPAHSADHDGAATTPTPPLTPQELRLLPRRPLSRKERRRRQRALAAK